MYGSDGSTTTLPDLPENAGDIRVKQWKIGEREKERKREREREK